MTTTTLPTTRPRTAERAAGEAREKAGRARRDLEGTDAFTDCDEANDRSMPSEELDALIASFSRVGQMMLRAALDVDGLYPSKLLSTIRNGRTDIVPGKYEISHAPLPINKPEIIARFLVKRLKRGSKPEFTYTVDIVRRVNQKTGVVYEIPQCEAGTCGAYANTYGDNADVRHCKHAEAISLLWEAAWDEANREALAEISAQENPVLPALPVAPIASQQAVCPECNGNRQVPTSEGGFYLGKNDFVHRWIPCPTCHPGSTEPRRFYDEDDYRPPVSAETFAADWED